MALDGAGNVVMLEVDAGCETVACCQAVCVDGTNDEPPDPFCCDTEWDQTCADMAAAICRGLP